MLKFIIKVEEVYNVTFKGIIKSVEKHYHEASSEVTKAEYETFMRTIPCKACGGQRLNKESLAVTVAGKNIFEITDMSIKGKNTFLKEMSLGQS